MHALRYKKIGKTLVTSFMVLCLIALPLTHEGKPKKAEALFGFGGLGGLAGGVVVKDIGNTLTNTIQTLSTVALEQKELVLDGLFYNIAQKALQKVTGDILTYLNSGLDGNPAFVTDVLGYLKEVSDDAAGDFVYGGELDTVCEPFKLDVKIAEAEHYQEQTEGGTKKKLECTVAGGGTDIQKFLGGDFTAGGWGAWFEVSLHSQNTPRGATIAANVAFNDAVKSKQEAAMKELDWGNGVFSKKACTTVGGTKKCTITTPGILIQESASKALGAGIDSLLNAHEMNEVIGSVFGNLATQAISGVNGLLGLGGNASFSNNSFGTSGGLSYLDALKEESAAKKTTTVGDNKIQQALVTETKVLELELAIVDKIDGVTKLFAEHKKPFASSTCWKLTLPTKLSDTLDELTLKIPKTVSGVTTLQDLAEQYKNVTEPSAQLGILQQFTTLQTEGLVTGQSALIEYDFFLNTELKDTIATFTKAITAQELSCH